MRFERAQKLRRCWQESKTTQGLPNRQAAGAAQGGRASDVGQCEPGYLWPRINLPLKADALEGHGT